MRHSRCSGRDARDQHSRSAGRRRARVSAELAQACVGGAVPRQTVNVNRLRRASRCSSASGRRSTARMRCASVRACSSRRTHPRVRRSSRSDARRASSRLRGRRARPARPGSSPPRGAVRSESKSGRLSSCSSRWARRWPLQAASGAPAVSTASRIVDRTLVCRVGFSNARATRRGHRPVGST